MRNFRILIVGLLVLGVAVAMSLPALADSDGAAVTMKAIGNPIWEPVDFHVFSAPVGFAADGLPGFAQTQGILLPPPNHLPCADLGIGPGAPHQPPYNGEIDGHLDQTNFRESLVFRVPDFTAPNGIYLVWMVVPHPGTIGSSPDFTSGPIIPNTLFPIHLAGQTFRNQQLWDPFLATFDVPPLTDALSCPFNVDGHSHFPIFIAEDTEFGPGGPATGRYEFRITMTDKTGNGWSITGRFKVRPAPPQ